MTWWPSLFIGAFFENQLCGTEYCDTHDFSKPKYYVLDMFPYPSGQGLHVGHPEGYTATDIVARMKRMQGFNVLHPMGWDAFGCPRSNSPSRTTASRGLHPGEHRQLQNQIHALGFSYDWSKEIATIDPSFYKWTQWIFLQLYAHDLAYVSNIPVNYCPELGTVLANEEVVDGKSEVGGFDVIRMPMRQWILKITAYADRLAEDLEGLNWPKSTLEMQRNWIGRSEGVAITFKIRTAKILQVFTTRVDTLFGCTYCCLAPEHPLVKSSSPRNKKKRWRPMSKPPRPNPTSPHRHRKGQDRRLSWRRCHQSDQRPGRFRSISLIMFSVPMALVPLWPSLPTTKETMPSPRSMACR